MGWHAARKLRLALVAFSNVVAIKLLAGARALALRGPLVVSPLNAAVSDRVNAVSGGPGHDRWLSPEIAAVAELVRSGELLDVVGRFVTLN
jgi:histidine ammonia-lyase